MRRLLFGAVACLLAFLGAPSIAAAASTPTVIAISSNQNPLPYGDSVIFTVVVSGSPTPYLGTVTVCSSATACGTGTTSQPTPNQLCQSTLPSSGQVTCHANLAQILNPNPTCGAPGNRCTGAVFSITAVYSGATNSHGSWAGSSTSYQETLLGERYANAHITFNPNPDPQTLKNLLPVAQPVTATITMRPANKSVDVAPTGTVTLTDRQSSTTVCTSTLVPTSSTRSVATCTFTPTNVGATLTSDEGTVLDFKLTTSGDITFAPRTGSTTINRLLTLTGVGSSAPTLTPALPVHESGKRTVLDVSVPQRTRHTPIPQVKVVVTDPNGQPVGGRNVTCSLEPSASANAVERCPFIPLIPGTYEASLTYSGDQNHGPGSAGPVPLYVSGSGHDRLHLTTSASRLPRNTAVTITATVTAGTVSPGGSVFFLGGRSPLSCAGGLSGGWDVPLKGGVAACTYTPTQTAVGGSTKVWAYYSGDSNHAVADRYLVEYLDGPSTSTASLSSNLNPATSGQPVTFVAKVTGSASGLKMEPNPTGTVSFTVGTTQTTVALVPSATGNSATATWTTASLPVGTDTVRASYSGDNTYNAAVTNTVSQVITAG